MKPVSDTADSIVYLGLREPREKPDGDAIAEAVRRAVRNGTYYWQKLEQGRDVLLCDWEGRDGSGRTGRDSNNRLRGPFAGSCDSDIALVAEALKEKTDMLRLAVAQGSLNAIPQDGVSDAVKAAYAAQELHYYLNGPMKRNVLKTLAQAAKWHRGFGSYVIALDWRRRTHGYERTLTLEGVYAWAVQTGTRDFLTDLAAGLAQAGQLTIEDIEPEDQAAAAAAAQQAGAEALQEVQQRVYDRAGLDELEAVLQAYCPALTSGEARRAAREFQRGKIEAVVCCEEIVEDRPDWRGLRPGVDVLFPPETETIAEAEWVVEPRWLTARQVRELSVAEGWDPKWTAELLKTPGMPFGLMQWTGQFPWLLTTTAVGAGIPWEYREKELFCPMLFTYRGASKSGCGAIYQCLVHDKIEGFGFHEMLDSIDGLMPYEDMRSDECERILLECRGLTEEAESYQHLAKGNMDATFDMFSMLVNPPVVKPSRLEGQSVRELMGPGAELSVNRTDPPNAWQFLRVAENSTTDMGERMDKHLRLLMCRRFGLRHPELKPELAQASWQIEVDDFLSCVSVLLRRTYAAIQAYGPETVRLRVTEQPGILAATGGADAPPPVGQLVRDEIRGSFDFSITFDTRNLVAEWVEQRGKQLVAALTIDNLGAVPRVPILRSLMAMTDPKLAGQVKGENEAMHGQLERTQAEIAAIVSGQEPPFAEGQNHRLAMQYAQQAVQQSPLLQGYLQNPQIAAVFENWLKQHEMQVMQEQNKMIGRTGGRPVLSGGIKGNGQ